MTMFRILDGLAPIAPGARFHFALDLGREDESWLGLADAEGDYPLFINVTRSKGMITLAQRIGGSWGANKAIRFYQPLTERASGSLSLSVEVQPDRIFVGLGSGTGLGFPLAKPGAAIGHVDAVGRWRTTRSDQGRGALVIEPLPAAEKLQVVDRKLIFDIGMHLGTDTAFYLQKGFRVVAVEANPLLAEQATLRFAEEIEAGALTVLNVGIAGKAGSFPFYVNKVRSEWSSFDPEIASRGDPVEPVDVRTITSGDLFLGHGVPYYAKVDIGGYDWQAIDCLAELPAKPPFVSVENGGEFFVSALEAAGYSSFKYVNQAEVQDFLLPEPALEGKYVDHRFVRGSSGPFGAETPGPWLDGTAIRKVDLKKAGAWFDLHARHGSGPPAGKASSRRSGRRP